MKGSGGPVPVVSVLTSMSFITWFDVLCSSSGVCISKLDRGDAYNRDER